MMTSVPVSPLHAVPTSTKGRNSATTTTPSRRVTVSVVSVHGSIRTAKLHTMQNIRKHFHHQQQLLQPSQDHHHHNNTSTINDDGSKQKAKMERELQECLIKIQTME
jgi:hypothetical protein